MSIILILAAILSPPPGLETALSPVEPEVVTVHRDASGALLLLRHYAGIQLVRVDAVTLAATVVYTSGARERPTRRITFECRSVDGVLVSDGKIFIHAWEGIGWDRPLRAPGDYRRSDPPRESGSWMLSVHRLSDGVRIAHVPTPTTDGWLEEHPGARPTWLRGNDLAGRMEKVDGGVSVLGTEVRLPSDD